MDWPNVFFYALGGILIVLGVIKARRKEKGAFWLMVPGCVLFVLGAVIL